MSNVVTLEKVAVGGGTILCVVHPRPWPRALGNKFHFSFFKYSKIFFSKAKLLKFSLGQNLLSINTSNCRNKESRIKKSKREPPETLLEKKNHIEFYIAFPQLLSATFSFSPVLWALDASFTLWQCTRERQWLPDLGQVCQTIIRGWEGNAEHIRQALWSSVLHAGRDQCVHVGGAGGVPSLKEKNKTLKNMKVWWLCGRAHILYTEGSSSEVLSRKCWKRFLSAQGSGGGVSNTWSTGHIQPLKEFRLSTTPKPAGREGSLLPRQGDSTRIIAVGHHGHKDNIGQSPWCFYKWLSQKLAGLHHLWVPCGNSIEKCHSLLAPRSWSHVPGLHSELQDNCAAWWSYYE